MGRPGLARNPKFRRLAHVLDREHSGFGELIARGVLEALWEAAYENGDPRLGDAVAVEAVAGWKGNPGVLCAALLDAGGPGRAGFIEPAPDLEGAFQVHDLFDHAPEYVAGRREREGERRKSKTCAGCGRAFHSPDKRAKHCSHRCRTATWRDRHVTDACVTVTHGDTPPAPAPAPAPARKEEKKSFAAAPPSPPDGEKPKRVRKEPTGPAADCFRHWREVVWPKLSPESYPTDHGGDHTQLAAKVKAYGPERVKAAMDRYAADTFWRDKIRTLRGFCSHFPNFLERATGPPQLEPAKEFKRFENDKEIWE